MGQEQNLISPTQIRGSSYAAAALGEDKQVRISLRTRGPIRRAPEINSTTTIAALVSDLRHDNGGHPLVAVVFASRLSEPNASTRFVEALRRCFDLPSDAIWGVELEPPPADVQYGTEAPSVILSARSTRDSFL